MIILKGILKSVTPFMIGNGDNINSDRDILLTPEGKPFIPGTTIAGICRHYFSENNMDDIDIIFGSHDNKTMSSIIFYDAYMSENEKKDNNIYPSIRESVRLENRIAVDKSKFDYEIMKAGVSFNFRIELNIKNKEDKSTESIAAEEKKICSEIVSGFNSGDIRVGSKTTRGFGTFALEDVKYKAFDLTKQDDMKKYIDFYAYDDESSGWSSDLPCESSKTGNVYDTIKDSIRLKNFLLIRDYSTTAKVDDSAESKFVDVETLCNDDGNPVIPGTALAGVFRHHSERILKRSMSFKNDADELDKKKTKDFLNKWFGYKNDIGEKIKPDDISKSRILFLEAVIDKRAINMINRTRTAIDRFSGSALQTGALYTERIACNKDSSNAEASKIDLVIKIKKGTLKNESEDELKLIKSLIKCCIEDLKAGILSIGGNSAIGAGIFKGLEEGTDGKHL